MLMTMEPEIQQNLEPLHAHEMLKELKTLFAQQAEQELLQTTRDFHSCRQEEGLSEYDGFVQNSNMHNMGKTVNELHAMLKLHEQTLPKGNAPALNVIRAGHWKRNCPQYLAELMKKKKNTASGAGGLEIVLNNCHYAPSITRGVIFVSRLYEDGFVNRFIDNAIQVSRNNVVYFYAIPRDGIFEIDLSNSLTNESSVYAVSNKRAKLDLDSALLWHCRLGHISKKRIESCNMMDFSIHLTLGHLKNVSLVCLERWQGNLTHIKWKGPKTYLDYRYGYVYLLKHKHKVFETFKVFQKEVENQLGKTIKSLRSYHGGEYMSQEFLDHLKDHGIITHRTPPYTPQHNGVSERRNRTLLDMVRSMMSQTTLPKSFWDYALETVARILNMVPTKKVEKTPYKVWHRKAPKLSYLKSYRSRSKWNLEDLEIIQEEDTHPSLDTSLNHEEDDLEIDEPQSDIVPIRRSTRTRHAPDPSSESRPPMLNKENYVPWSSRLLRYAKSRPHGKLIHNSILNGPYVIKMVPEPSDANREIIVTETFHLRTDDELSDKELKQIEADDQAIQTIFLQMMKGSDIRIQEKKAKLFNEWERFTSNEGESIESYYPRFLKLMNNLKRNKHFIEKIAINLKFLNNLQPEWSRHVTIVHQTKDLHTADYTQLYDFLKYNQKEEKLKLSKSQGASTLAKMKRMQNVPYALAVGSIMYAVRCTRLDVAFAQNITSRFQQNPDADDLKSQTEYVFVLNGGAVDWKSAKQSIFATSSAEAEYIAAFDASKEAVWVRKFISGLSVVPTIEEPISMYCDNTGAIAIANEFGITKDDNLADPFTKALAFPKHSEHTKNIGMLPASSLILQNLANEADASHAKHKALELEIERLLKAVVSQDIIIIVQNESIVATSDLQTELERTKECFENVSLKRKLNMLNFGMIGNLKLLINFIWKFMGTVRFRNDHVAAILGFGQFCDSDLEVAFRRNACFVRNLEGVDLLKGDRSTNPYTINLHEMASASPICLMARASSTNINGKRYVLLIVDDYSRYTWVYFLRSKDEAPEVIIKFLKRISVLLQSPVIIIRTDNDTKFKNQVLKEYFDTVGISHQMSSVRTPQQNGVIERCNRTLVEATRTMLIFLVHRYSYGLRRLLLRVLLKIAPLFTVDSTKHHMSLLTTENQISHFFMYSVLCVIPRMIVKTLGSLVQKVILVSSLGILLTPVLSDSKPRLQSMTSGHISSGLDLTYAPSTITMQQPSEDELDLLFEAMYDNYIGGQPSATARTVPPAQEPQVRQLSMASTTIANTAPIPTNSSSLLTNIPISSQDVDELNPNTIVNGNTFVNLFANSSTSTTASSSHQNVDPSNMHTFYQPYPHEFQWTKDHPLEQNKHDEEQTVIRNKSRLVVRGYRQEEGINFEESFALVARMEAIRIFLAYAAHKSFTAKPTEKHLKEVKRIFRYLRGTVKTGLWYTKDSGFELTRFSDADYAGCKDTFKSTSGGAQFLREKLLTDYGFHFNKILIYCDSKSAIAISCNPVQHSRTKHIAVLYHFIKEHVEKGTIELYFVKTDYQLADIFTKALPTDRFNYLVRRLDNEVWVLVELPPNGKTVGSKWLFKKMTDMDGNVHICKALLVAKGFTQTQGIDYEETFSPVADIRAIRILIAIAAYNDYEIWQMDVKTAFLNGYLNEEKFGFTQNRDEPCVYIKASGSNITFLILYVDEILIMGNSIPMLQSVKPYLGKCFAMKDLGEAAYILGIKIYRDRSKRLIGLCQSVYIEKILKRYCMENSKRGIYKRDLKRELRVSCYTDVGYLMDADDLKS
uniref:Retrotransposon protein, putative, Ty1-copia subclass n=1 Tax=Tanacetum cinerariifolium TaxID=118510 RepID=A0A6L2M4G7_TANCI|nr:retrotransposon protein, putative, Ty1-copia subclass [Tanacetum cinerariifolium]